MFDADGDGWLDLLLVGQAGTGNTGTCALYRNLKDGRFADVSRGSGLEAKADWMGAAAGDYDNDGRTDLYLTGYGRCALYHNMGTFRFRDVAKAAGVAARNRTEWSTSAVFFDYDRDGLLDLYVGRYCQFGPPAPQLCNYGAVRGACGIRHYDPQYGVLYRNEGNGTFNDATVPAGLASQHGKCLGAAVGDVNNDGWPDLYLANDEVPGDLFLNDHGRFRNIGPQSGTAFGPEGRPQGGMGADLADFNNDGRLDLFVATFETESKSLYENDGNGLFTQVSDRAGLSQPLWNDVAFGARLVDLDNDGWLDLAVASGHVRDNVAMINPATTYAQPTRVFRNLRGERFESAGSWPRDAFCRPVVGRGLAAGDLFNDGRSDLLIMDLEGPPLLLANQVASHGHWIRVELKTRGKNRSAIGARVTVISGGVQQVREVTAGGSYLSASDPRLLFGLGDAEVADRVLVRWPDGRTVERRHIPARTRLVLTQK